LNLYTKLASTMKAFAEDANQARSHSIRVMDNDSTRDFTLAEVVPAARNADKSRALEDAPHFETFLHALEYSRRRLLSQSGISCSELECPKGPVEGIILNRDSFPVLGGKGLSGVDTLPPYVKFDDNGEFAIDMEFHDGFAYDTNPHGLGFYDRGVVLSDAGGTAARPCKAESSPGLHGPSGRDTLRCRPEVRSGLANALP
jgi:hypothetical protein